MHVVFYTLKFAGNNKVSRQTKIVKSKQSLFKKPIVEIGKIPFRNKSITQALQKWTIKI